MRCEDGEMDPSVRGNFEGGDAGEPGGQEPDFMVVEENVEREKFDWGYGDPSFW